MIRDMVNETLRRHCQYNKKDFREVWNILYKQFRKTFHINLKVRARNRNMSPIAYAEKNGYIAALLGMLMIVLYGA